MTSEIEEAVARVTMMRANMQGAPNRELRKDRQALGALITALSASQAEVERLTLERDEALALIGSDGADVAYQFGRAQAAEARATRAEGLLEEAGEWERRCANVEAVLSSLSKAAWRVVNARDAFRSPDRTNHPNLVLEEAEAWITLREALDGKLPRATRAEGLLEEAGEVLGLMRAAFCAPLPRRAMGGHDPRQQEATLAARAFLDKLKGEG